MSLKTRNKVDPAFNMSSLADIIFLLLIFFLITSRFVTQSSVDINRPKSSQEKPVKPNARISINNKLQYFLDGEPIAAGQLKSALRAALVGVDDKTVVLDMDKTLPIEKLVELSDLTQDLQVKLVLSTDKKK